MEESRVSIILRAKNNCMTLSNGPYIIACIFIQPCTSTCNLIFHKKKLTLWIFQLIWLPFLQIPCSSHHDSNWIMNLKISLLDSGHVLFFFIRFANVNHICFCWFSSYFSYFWVGRPLFFPTSCFCCCSSCLFFSLIARFHL